jgi:hypothetical protein
MTDEHATELFEERAAIMQYDGKLSKAEAEKRAYFELKKRLNGQPVPEAVKKVCKTITERLFE